MSLVAYGSCSSDESEDDTDRPIGLVIGPTSRGLHEPNTSGTSFASTSQDSVKKDFPHNLTSIQSVLKNLPKPKHEVISKREVEENHSNKSLGLFNSLPLPKSKKHVGLGLSLFDFESDKKSVVSNKKTVKISVPSLSQFKNNDDGEPVKKKVKPSPMGSGLFSLLPAPKNTIVKETKRALVPHVLTKKLAPKPDVPSVTTSTAAAVKILNSAPHTVEKPLKPLSLTNYEDSGEDSEEESEKPKDFFSLHSDTNFINKVIDVSPVTSTSAVEFSEVADCELEEVIPNDQPLAFVSGFQPSPWAHNQPQLVGQPSWPSCGEQSTSHEPSEDEPSEVADYISVVEDDIQLDDEALQRLCGRRAKSQQMEFINVNGSEIMPDPKEWLVKQLSQEQPKMRSHSHKKNDGPTTQQRRKHQITYLAFQAKENELELKNQWSQNRMSRKQTQSKYGF